MDDPGSTSARARRAPDPRCRIGVAAGLVALVAVLGLAGCSRRWRRGRRRRRRPRSRHAHDGRRCQLGDVSADSAGPPATVTPEQAQAVLDVVSTYVKDATVQPLRTAQPATADLAGVFDAATLAPATDHRPGRGARRRPPEGHR